MSLSDFQTRSAGPTWNQINVSSGVACQAGGKTHFHPGLRITQRCVSVELIEYVADLYINVRALGGGRFKDSKILPWLGSISARVALPPVAKSLLVEKPLSLVVKLLPFVEWPLSSVVKLLPLVAKPLPLVAKLLLSTSQQ